MLYHPVVAAIIYAVLPGYCNLMFTDTDDTKSNLILVNSCPILPFNNCQFGYDANMSIILKQFVSSLVHGIILQYPGRIVEGVNGFEAT